MRRHAKLHTGRAAPLLLAGKLTLLSVLATAAGQGHTLAQNAAIPEYDVKAAFLFNIAKYAEWPPSVLPAGAPIVVGVLGQDPFGKVLDDLVKGRLVNDRRITIRRAAHLADLKGCHIIFISPSERDRAPQICTLAESWKAVTVGDTPQVEPFAAINFSVDGGRIVFTANVDAASRSGVRISSKLLHLARAVRGGSKPTQKAR